MLSFIYNSLNAIGFTHPLHPVATHIPMGMVMGAFLFQLASVKWKYYEKTIFYSLALSLIIAPITIILGIMDWQYRYKGVVNGWIIAKLVFAAALFFLLAITVYLQKKGKMNDKLMWLLTALCFICVTGLGFIGGQLIFG